MAQHLLYTECLHACTQFKHTHTHTHTHTRTHICGHTLLCTCMHTLHTCTSVHVHTDSATHWHCLWACLPPGDSTFPHCAQARNLIGVVICCLLHLWLYTWEWIYCITYHVVLYWLCTGLYYLICRHRRRVLWRLTQTHWLCLTCRTTLSSILPRMEHVSQWHTPGAMVGT